MGGQMDFENSLWLMMSFVHHIIIYQLIHLLVDAKYLRVGNNLFLCVQGWGREHQVNNITNSWRFASSRN